jgi:hypothetical protein
MFTKQYLPLPMRGRILRCELSWKAFQMNLRRHNLDGLSAAWLGSRPSALAGLVLLCVVMSAAMASFAAIKNMALVVAADSKLPDLSFAELTRLCKGTQKTWPDGRPFTLVIKDPTIPEMHVPILRILGASPAESKAAVAKINEVRVLIKIVATDEDVFRSVTSIPGAMGIVDVYSINSAVKVLHVDGKLPFDAGYPLK